MAWIGIVPNVPAHSNFAMDGRAAHTWRKYSSIEDKATIGEDDLRNPAYSLPCNKGQYAIFFRGAVNFMESWGITLQFWLWGVKLCLTLIYRPIVLITKMLFSFYKGMKHDGDGTEGGLTASVEYSQGFFCLCGMSDEGALLSFALLCATSWARKRCKNSSILCLHKWHGILYVVESLSHVQYSFSRLRFCYCCFNTTENPSSLPSKSDI
jgi:hypothetical protein